MMTNTKNATENTTTKLETIDRELARAARDDGGWEGSAAASCDDHETEIDSVHNQDGTISHHCSACGEQV